MQRLAGIRVVQTGMTGQSVVDEFALDPSGRVVRLTSSPATIGAAAMSRGVWTSLAQAMRAVPIAEQYGIQFSPNRPVHFPSDGAAFLVAIWSVYAPGFPHVHAELVEAVES